MPTAACWTDGRSSSPYAMSDYATTFATLAFLLSLAEMQLMRNAVTVFNPPAA